VFFNQGVVWCVCDHEDSVGTAFESLLDAIDGTTDAWSDQVTCEVQDSGFLSDLLYTVTQFFAVCLVHQGSQETFRGSAEVSLVHVVMADKNPPLFQGMEHFPDYAKGLCTADRSGNDSVDVPNTFGVESVSEVLSRHLNLLLTKRCKRSIAGHFTCVNVPFAMPK
jgi:hypothetical protein